MARYTINPMDKGYVQIYTGDGKGKSTAAVGLAMRAVGAGLKVYIGQFIKDMEYGEIALIRERVPEITVELYGSGEGCIFGRESNAQDVENAKAGCERAKAALISGEYDVVILDEITIPVSMGVLSENAVLDLIDNRPENVELIITGRRATEKILDAADLVSDMKEVKHYYDKGVLSRKGIEC